METALRLNTSVLILIRNQYQKKARSDNQRCIDALYSIDFQAIDKFPIRKKQIKTFQFKLKE